MGNRLVTAGAWEEKKQGVLSAMEHVVCFGGDENVLVLESGDDCTTYWFEGLKEWVLKCINYASKTNT